jgi:hypothetical protein
LCGGDGLVHLDDLAELLFWRQPPLDAEPDAKRIRMRIVHPAMAVSVIVQNYFAATATIVS